MVQYMAPPGVPSWITGTAYAVPASVQGAITVSAQGVDRCDGVGTSSVIVRIDTTKPRTKTAGDVTVKGGKKAGLGLRVVEPANLSPAASVVIKIRGAANMLVKSLVLANVNTNTERVVRFTCRLEAGTYMWYVYATDLAGNQQANVAHASLTVTSH